VVVQITDQELDIHTHVPFNWFFLPEIYDLEFRVPIERILSAKQLRKFFAVCVEIEFTTLDGNGHKVSLWLRRPDEFLETLRQSPIVLAPVQPT